MSKTTIAAVVMAVFGTIAAMDVKMLSFLHGYADDVHSFCVFAAIISGSVMGILSKDWNQTGGPIALTKEAAERNAAPGATDKPVMAGVTVSGIKASAMLAFCLVGLQGCAPISTTVATSPPVATVGTSDIALNLVRLGAASATVIALDELVSDSTKRNALALQINRGAASLLAVTNAGAVPTVAQIQAVLPSLASLYTSLSPKIGGDAATSIKVVTALAQGAQDATNPSVTP